MNFGSSTKEETIEYQLQHYQWPLRTFVIQIGSQLHVSSCCGDGNSNWYCRPSWKKKMALVYIFW